MDLETKVANRTVKPPLCIKYNLLCTLLTYHHNFAY
jgi:hypothetical protein